MSGTSEIYLVLAILSSAMMAIILKVFSREEENRYAILMGNYLACVVVGFLSLPEKTLVFHIDAVTLLCSMVGGILFTGGLVCMQTGIRVNGASLTAAFARLGLIVPLVMSIVIFREKPGVLQVLGILLVLAAIWIISRDRDEEEKSSVGIQETGPAQEKKRRGGSSACDSLRRVNLAVLLLTLLACGASDAMAKVYEHVGDRAKDELYYMCIFLTAFLITCVLVYMEYRRTGKKVTGRMLFAGLAVGIPNYYSSYLLLKALVHLPAFIVYPCFSTGAIFVVTIISALLLKERLNRRKLTGLVMIMTALVLLNL